MQLNWRIMNKSLLVTVISMVFTCGVTSSLLAATTANSVSKQTSAVNGTKIYLSSKKLSFQKPAIMIRNSIYVEMAPLLKVFGFEVAEDIQPSEKQRYDLQMLALADGLKEPPQMLFIRKGTEVVQLIENQPSIVHNGLNITWEFAPQIINGVWYMPLRSFAEWQGFEVKRAKLMDLVYLMPTIKYTLDQMYMDEENWEYDGELFDGLRQGQGKLYYKQKLVYDGYFQNDLMDGPALLYLDGRLVYDGAFKANYPDGYGTEYFVNGEQYEGNFVAGLKSGNGILRLGKSVLYDGEWNNNQMQGSGVIYDRNKQMAYDGAMLANKRHGLGTLYKDGKKAYRGNWSYGKKHGEGVLFDSTSGKVLYDGLFEADYANGNGTSMKYTKISSQLKSSAGKVFKVEKDAVYWSQVLMRDGKIVRQDSRLLLYVGNVGVDGLPNGEGAFYTPLDPNLRKFQSLEQFRKVFEGKFESGALQGEGTIYNLEGAGSEATYEGESIWTLGW